MKNNLKMFIIWLGCIAVLTFPIVPAAEVAGYLKSTFGTGWGPTGGSWFGFIITYISITIVSMHYYAKHFIPEDD